MALQDSQSTARPPLGDLDEAAGFEAGLVEFMPLVRTFALSLSGHRELAEDLAQETLAKAWGARQSFTPGSNLKAWVFAILRNEFYSRQRRDWRQVPWNDALGETIAAPPGEQHWAVELSDTACAMRGLSDPQREALILVGVGGFSQDDAAALSKTPVGTVKSRVGRARKALKEILDSQRSLPMKSRPASGDAMREILAQLTHFNLIHARLAGGITRLSGTGDRSAKVSS
jgi:RNA polymerase sigma-70 factor, ECF subfamily